MQTTVYFQIDTDALPQLTDSHLAVLWHICQANPAPFGLRDACQLAEHVGREIIRRFVSSQPPELWAHQGVHHELNRRMQHAEDGVRTPAAD